MARPDPGPDMKRLAEEFVALMSDLDWKLDSGQSRLKISPWPSWSSTCDAIPASRTSPSS
jgi:hypothetical protein